MCVLARGATPLRPRRLVEIRRRVFYGRPAVTTAVVCRYLNYWSLTSGKRARDPARPAARCAGRNAYKGLRASLTRASPPDPDRRRHGLRILPRDRCRRAIPSSWPGLRLQHCLRRPQSPQPGRARRPLTSSPPLSAPRVLRAAVRSSEAGRRAAAASAALPSPRTRATPHRRRRCRQARSAPAAPVRRPRPRPPPWSPAAGPDRLALAPRPAALARVAIVAARRSTWPAPPGSASAAQRTRPPVPPQATGHQRPGGGAARNAADSPPRAGGRQPRLPDCGWRAATAAPSLWRAHRGPAIGPPSAASRCLQSG
eukprot:scaffold25122_cov66-Phaeocystis_antarctica.AAC.4